MPDVIEAPNPPREYVPVDELDTSRVQLSITPFPTVFMFALGAIATREEAFGAGPPEWKRAVRTRLRARDLEALAPLGDPRTSTWPNGLAGTFTPGLSSFEESLEQTLSIDMDSFVAEAEEGWGDRPVESWLPATRDPERWLRDFGEAMRRTWSAIEPLWERAAPLVDRETERVGAGIALGAGGQVLNELHPRSSIVDGEWRFNMHFPRPERWSVSDDFVVAPLVVEDACFVADDNADALTAVCYPLQGAWRAFDDEEAPPTSLEGLLGAQRARILLALDRPTRPGELADRMFLTPGAVTYQVRALEGGSLVTRSRQGRNVMVERTDLGSALLDLYRR